jgi:hypothetical protein
MLPDAFFNFDLGYRPRRGRSRLKYFAGELGRIAMRRQDDLTFGDFVQVSWRRVSAKKEKGWLGRPISSARPSYHHVDRASTAKLMGRLLFDDSECCISLRTHATA